MQKRLGTLLILAGLAIAAWPAATWAYGVYWQMRLAQEFPSTAISGAPAHTVRVASSDPAAAAPSPARPATAAGEVSQPETTVKETAPAAGPGGPAPARQAPAAKSIQVTIPEALGQEHSVPQQEPPAPQAKPAVRPAARKPATGARAPAQRPAAQPARVRTAAPKAQIAAGKGPSAPMLRRTVRTGQAFARLRIKRIGLNTVVVSGVTAKALRRGPGHMPRTGLPGENRNCAIAAHRDGWFRRLDKVKKGDAIQIETADAVYEYVVGEKQVVTPDRGDLLDRGANPVLTLITCTGPGYPNSKYRLLVFAELRSVSPRT